MTLEKNFGARVRSPFCADFWTESRTEEEVKTEKTGPGGGAFFEIFLKNFCFRFSGLTPGEPGGQKPCLFSQIFFIFQKKGKY